MDVPNETWTAAHDLALVFIALAYGTDHDLSDEEIETITDALQHWRPDWETAVVEEVIMEAMAVYLEADTKAEVGRAIYKLRDGLSDEELRRALEQVVRIAEADGIMLSTEQSLITTLGEAWALKSLSQELIDQTSVSVESVSRWSLLHDVVLVSLVIAHSTDEELSEVEIDAITQRIQQWQPGLSRAEAQDTLREVLRVYAQEPGEDMLRQAVQSLKNALSPVQRILVLDDLNHIAHADGTMHQHEREMIASLAEAWEVLIRLSGNSHA